jgi:hypothetical protein
MMTTVTYGEERLMSEITMPNLKKILLPKFVYKSLYYCRVIYLQENPSWPSLRILFRGRWIF